MFKLLDNEHLCGAAKLKKKAHKMIEDGKCGGITKEEFDSTMTNMQPVMEYACRRGMKIGAVAVVAGVLIAGGAEMFGPRIREAVMKKLGK